MNRYAELSEECGKSELDLFTRPKLQTEIDESIYTRVNPITSTANSDSPIEFVVPGSANLFLDPSQVFLHLKASIKKDNGSSDIANGYGVYPEKGFLYSAFKNCEIYLNDTLVNSSCNLYPFRSHIQTLLNYSNEAKSGFLAAAGYYGNIDRDAHVEKFKKSRDKIFEVYGRIYSDILQQERLLLNGVDMKIKLVRSDARFCIKTSDDATLPYGYLHPIILEASLYVRRVKISPSKQLAIERELDKSNALYPITKIEPKMLNISAGLTVAELANISLGTIPNKVVVCLVDHKAVNGDYRRSGLEFHHNNLTSVALYVNGNVTSPPYEMKYSRTDSALSLCARAYMNMHIVSGCEDELGSGISLEDFAERTNLYIFNLSPDLNCCNDFSYTSPTTQAALSLRLTFAEPTPQPLSVLLLYESNAIIEITKSRQVLFD